MRKTYEIFLSKKEVTKEEWNSLLYTISKYNGIFRKWKIYLSIHDNKIRYFVETNCSLPSQINNLDAFVFKNHSSISIEHIIYSFPYIINVDKNAIDLVEFFQIKKQKELSFIKITIRKLGENKFLTKTIAYAKKENELYRHRLFFAIPKNILTLNFENNKIYFYNSAPKYLDISKSLHLLNSDSSTSVLKIDTFPYLQGDFYLNQNSYSFNKHSVVIGSSGCGKSKFISLLINNINKNIELKQKYKVVVIDPHASLENDIGGIGKVIDFKSARDSIDLFINKSDDVVASTELLVELFKSLIADQYNSKLERVLRHSIHVLLEKENFNFSNLRKLLLDIEYRNSLIKELKDILPNSVIDFFLSDFNDLKTKSYGEAISPIIAFIDEMEMIPVFNEDQSENNLKDTIHDHFLTLFSLDRTKLGDKVTKTIAGLIMQQLLTLIQSYSFEEHIIFIIDEVAVVENPILSRYLSEARKYDLSLLLAGQYFSQISEDLKNSILANVVNYYIFRVSKLDANILVDNFNMKIPLDNTRERKIKLLTELENRKCIVRIDKDGMLLPAFSASTLDFTSIPRIKKQEVIKETIEKEKQVKKGSNTFKITNVDLKDILIKNSSSRKVVK